MSNKYPPNANFASKSHISNMDKYKKMYESSINDPSGFWEKAAERISWYESWNAVSNHNFIDGKIEWFAGGKLNIKNPNITKSKTTDTSVSLF